MSVYDQSIILGCNGNLTIAHASALHESIRSALDHNASVMIDCAGADDVDVAFIQILISAQRTAKAQRKALDLSAPADGVLAAALARLGLSPADLSCAAPALIH